MELLGATQKFVCMFVYFGRLICSERESEIIRIFGEWEEGDGEPWKSTSNKCTFTLEQEHFLLVMSTQNKSPKTCAQQQRDIS